MLCDPFGLDHSATDIYYPHLSLCGANSFFLAVRPLCFSALQILSHHVDGCVWCSHKHQCNMDMLQLWSSNNYFESALFRNSNIETINYFASLTDSGSDIGSPLEASSPRLPIIRTTQVGLVDTDGKTHVTAQAKADRLTSLSNHFESPVPTHGRHRPT